MSDSKVYRSVCPLELDKAGEFYSRHIAAMTSEDLHSKSAIAEQLGARDKRIAELEAVITNLRSGIQSFQCNDRSCINDAEHDAEVHGLSYKCDVCETRERLLEGGE